MTKAETRRGPGEQEQKDNQLARREEATVSGNHMPAFVSVGNYEERPKDSDADRILDELNRIPSAIERLFGVIESEGDEASESPSK